MQTETYRDENIILSKSQVVLSNQNVRMRDEKIRPRAQTLKYYLKDLKGFGLYPNERMERKAKGI